MNLKNNNNYNKNNFSMENNNRIFKNLNKDKITLPKQITNYNNNILKMNFNTINVGIFNPNNNNNNLYNDIIEIQKNRNKKKILRPVKTMPYQENIIQDFPEKRNFINLNKANEVISPNNNKIVIPVKYYRRFYKSIYNTTSEV